MAAANGVKIQKHNVHELSIKNITADPEVQPRGMIDLDVVRDYSDAMVDGAEFPPVSVFFDGITYWLADGFHRYNAAIKAGRPSIRCVVFQGGKDDAILFSVGANAEHGIRRTTADRKRVVVKMLNHPEWCLWSDAEIARRCRVSASTVTRHRENSPGLIGHNVTLRVDRNGHVSDRCKERPAMEAKPSSPIKLPPVQLSKSELGDEYAKPILRALKKRDASVRGGIDTPFGAAVAVDKTRAYILATAGERHAMFGAIGRAFLVAKHLGREPAILGHFPRSANDVIAEAVAHGFVVCTPESLIAESGE